MKVGMACFNYFLLCCSNESKFNLLLRQKFQKERFRPIPLCLPVLFPTAHALVSDDKDFYFLFVGITSLFLQ